jgi:hypothetical protein
MPGLPSATAILPVPISMSSSDTFHPELSPNASRTLARERLSGGYDLCEVQSVDLRALFAGTDGA